jgi:hypothetical protein
MHRTYFLIMTAVSEGATGLLLVVWPPLLLALLLGVEQTPPETLVSARIAGAALVALSVACWLGRNDHDRPAQKGLLLGALTYDLLAAGILGYAGWFLGLTGVVLWPAVALHTVLAVWCLVSLFPRSPGERNGTPGEEQVP